MTGTALFTWLQDAPFYRELHERAVALVPAGAGRWIDVGCGPGLVARLAAARGFEAEGWDPAPGMVRVARRLADARGSPARFLVAGLDALLSRPAGAAVVSATSLLAVVHERHRALEVLWSGVAPGGTLLVVETTSAMRPGGAWRWARGPRCAGLLLWALARRGRSCAETLDAWTPMDLAGRTFHPLLGGLVGAWVFHRNRFPLSEGASS